MTKRAVEPSVQKPKKPPRSLPPPEPQNLEGTKGVPRNGGRRSKLLRSRFTLDSLPVRTLTSTDIQTPFLGTPLAPLKSKRESGEHIIAITKIHTIDYYH